MTRSLTGDLNPGPHVLEANTLPLCNRGGDKLPYLHLPAVPCGDCDSRTINIRIHGLNSLYDFVKKEVIQILKIVSTYAVARSHLGGLNNRRRGYSTASVVNVNQALFLGMQYLLLVVQSFESKNVHVCLQWIMTNIY